MLGDDAVVQIMSRLGIDYGPAISATRQLAGEISRLDAQLKQLKVTAADLGRISGKTLAEQLAGDKVIYDQYGRAISIAAANTQVIQRTTKTATQAAKEHAKTVKDVAKQYNVLGSQFERRASWFIAGTAFFGSMTALRQAVETIAKVESDMTVIARVTEDAAFNFKEVRNQLLKLGQEYGMTWEQVSDIMTRWVQAGYNVSDSLELTRASLLALNTAELDANYATQGLIAIMAQWGLTADQLLPTIDKINKVADDFAVTSQDLVDGLNRSSGAARVLGLTLDQTIALLTVMREATGRTGKEVGNALNSILSFMQRDVALEAFAREGIAVWADEARTQFRNVLEIFEEVAARWPSMSEATREMFVQAAEQAGLYSEEMAELAGVQKEFNDLQQRDISQAMAGIYRRNYLLALLQNWAKIDQVLISMEDSLGYSMRENERTMQTLAKQYESLKAAAQELAVALGEAGLLSQLKELVEGAKDAVTWFNNLDPALRTLIITFVELTAVTKVLHGLLRMAGVAEGVAAIGTAISSAKNLTGVFSNLGAIVGTVGNALMRFFGGPWGLLVIGAGTAVVTLYNYMRQLEEQTRSNQNSLIQLGEQYDILSAKLSAVAEGTEEHKNLHQQLQQTMNAIADIMPQVVAQWDAYGNAIALNNDLLRENIVLAQQAMRAEYDRKLTELSRRRLELQRLIEEEAKTQEDVSKYLDVEPGQYFIPRVPDAEKIRQYRQELSQIAEEINRIGEYFNQTAHDLGIHVRVSGAASTATARTSGKGYVGLPAGKSASKAAQEVDLIRERIQRLNDVMEQLDLANQQLQAELSRTAEKLDINAVEYDYLTAKIEAGTATHEEYARAQGLLSDKISLLEQQQQQLQQANEDYRQDIAALTPVLEEARRLYESLAQAGDVEHMREAQQAVSQLQSKIESLNNAIAQNTAQWWQNQRAIYEAMQAMSEDYYQRLSQWVEHLASTGRLTTQQQIEYYKAVDRTNLSLQTQWEIERKLYDLRRQALQEQMDKIREAYDERMQQIEEEIEAEEEATQRKIEQKERRIEAIDEETEAQIKALQELIDALDVEDEQADREEAERQHNQKLADLREEYQYHALRTGLEHQRRMAEILEEIAEEEHAWELQKQEWARQDQREAYQDQIDALKEQAETRKKAIQEEINELKKASDAKKKEFQKYYEEIQELMDESTQNMLAALSLYGDEYVDKVEEILERIKEAIEKNRLSLLPGLTEELEETLGEAEEEAEKKGKETIETGEPEEYPAAVFTKSDYIERNGRAYAWARLIGKRLGLPVVWDEKNWIVKIGSKEFSPDFMQDEKAYLGLRRVGEALGYEVDYKDGVVRYFPKAHTGAYVAESGIAELLKGERVLSPRLTVSFDRLANVLANFPDIPERISLMQQGYGNLDRLADKIVAAIERRKRIEIGNLFNAETVELADRTDMEILSRELARAVNMLQTARG